MNTNRLEQETSPYLRQHRHNPVDWYPWGDEAFARARDEDKPVFLSVGYSSCHWCHVMAHESFENEEVAAILNEHFVCIKVDREEHPDIDALYMTATHLMTGHGGWPNSVWLMPDRRPWYAGTYFPREDMPGRVGFKTLLTRLADVWREKRSEVEAQAEQLTQAVRQQNIPRTPEAGGPLDIAALLDNARRTFLSQYDEKNGGFGGAPKFPPHAGLLFLMATQDDDPDENIARIVRGTLDAMARGGIHDQVGGGFHRYATDDHWLLPHFEKMLYDNAALLKAYARAYAHDPQPRYRRIVEDMIAWLDREMTHPEGGFFAALDADSEGEEGKFYTWTYDEIIEVLGEDAGAEFTATYRIEPGGNFRDEATGRATGLNIPHLAADTDQDTVARLGDARAKLLMRRTDRVPPGLDSKVITAWNGQMISALAVAGRVLDEPDYIARAEKARAFIEKHLVRDGEVLRSWCDGKAEIPGVLEDYAALILADLDLFDAAQNQTYLSTAMERTSQLLDLFRDPDTGALYSTARDHATPLLRVREVFDQGSPSGIGLAAQAIVRAGIASDNPELVACAGTVLANDAMLMQRAPSGVSTLLEAAFLMNRHWGEVSLGDKPDISVNVPDSIVLTEDGAGTLEFSFNLPDGLHINELAPVKVTFAAGADSGEAGRISPDSPAYRVGVRLTNAADRLTGTIHYQLCTDSVCLPQDGFEFNLSVEKK